MNLIVERVDVWAASIKDEPGGLANKLATLAEEGADLALKWWLDSTRNHRPGCQVHQ